MHEKIVLRRVELPMICVCGDDTAEADALREEVKARLAQGSDELSPFQVSDANFLTCVIYSLHWDYNTELVFIGVDQWCGISAEKTIEYGYQNEYGDHTVINFYVQCDRVEDGLAALYKAVSEYTDD